MLSAAFGARDCRVTIRASTVTSRAAGHAVLAMSDLCHGLLPPHSGSEVVGEPDRPLYRCDGGVEVSSSQCCKTVSRFGHIDGVVAAAGQGRRGTPLTTSEADWHAECANKVSATLNPVRAAVANRSLSDAPREVTLSSVTATEPDMQLATSSAGRAAIASLTRTLATELASQRILVNAVAVGMIDTDRQRFIPISGSAKRSGDVAAPISVTRTTEEVAREIIGLLSARRTAWTRRIRWCTRSAATVTATAAPNPPGAHRPILYRCTASRLVVVSDACIMRV